MFKRTITPTRILGSTLLPLAGHCSCLVCVRIWSVGYPVGSMARASVSAAFCPHAAPAPRTTACLARQVSVIAAIVLQGILLYPGTCYYPLVLLLTWVDDATLSGRPPHYAPAQGFVATLVFPLAFTTLEYLSSFGPFGTINSIANYRSMVTCHSCKWCR